MKKALFLTLAIAAAGFVIANSTIGSVEAQPPQVAGDDTIAEQAAPAEPDAEVDEDTQAGWIETWTGIKAFGSGKCRGKSHRDGTGSCTGKSSSDDESIEPTLDSDQSV